MSRHTGSPTLLNEFLRSALPNVFGGTGVADVDDAAPALNAVPKTAMGARNGIGILDANQNIPSKYLSYLKTLLVLPMIVGPSYILLGETGIFTITNYDSFTTYELTAINGTISRNDRYVSFQPSTSSQKTGFTINGKTTYVTTIGNTAPIISGKTILGLGESINYTIENYSAANTYVLDTLDGSVTRSGNTITYTAPTVGGDSGFTVTHNSNTTTVNVSVIHQTPLLSVSSLQLSLGETRTIGITNYNTNDTYGLSVSVGTVSQENSVITYIAPMVAGIYFLTLMGTNGSATIPINVA